MHMVTARFGCVPKCMERLTKHYSHLDNQEYLLTIASSVGKVKVTSFFIKLGFGFGVRAWTEMEIWCIEGLLMLKVVLSEKNLKG